MSAAIENKIADVYDAARAYVAAKTRFDGNTTATWAADAVEVDRAWHDLLVACGYKCNCDEGTCPLEVSDV